MKIAIISDTHFGDPMCSLVSPSTPTQQSFSLTSKYDSFKNAIEGACDYLVLLGDIFDFSIAGYNKAYKAAQLFFQQINTDKLVKEIIYVPGNHDFTAWNILMHEINVINRIKAFGDINEQRWSCPGVLKDGKDPDKWFYLHKVTRKHVHPHYGNIFLESLTIPQKGYPSIPFNVAYPNVYFITNENECFLLTHGHYFEAAWAFAGKLLKAIARSDLKLKLSSVFNIEEIVSLNFPINELLSSGVGQAGQLTDIVRTVQREIKQKDRTSINDYIKGFKRFVPALLGFEWYQFFRISMTIITLNKISKRLIDQLTQHQSSRNDDQFLDSPENQKRLKNYYIACLLEIEEINNDITYKNFTKNNVDIPSIKNIIYGHTHRAIPVNKDKSKKMFIKSLGSSIRCYNTGGWLYDGNINPQSNVGGAVLVYETGKGFRTQLL